MVRQAHHERFFLIKKILKSVRPEPVEGYENRLNFGFSIIEIVISIAIIGTTLMALFGSQAASMRSVARGHQTVVRLYAIKNQILQQGMQPSAEEPVKTIEGQISKPKTMFNYSVKNISFESALAPLKNLYRVQASGQWRTMGVGFKEVFINLLFIPKKQKK